MTDLAALLAKLRDDDGEVIELSLTHGKACLIDAADWDKVSPYRWRAVPNCKKTSANWYVRGWGQLGPDGRPRNMFMHRFLVDAPANSHVDHINRNGLDNRRSNLRLCGAHGNQANRIKKRKCDSSPYKGVYIPQAYPDRFASAIRCNGTAHFLGSFATAEMAAVAYDRAALILFGEFARINFPRAIIEYIEAIDQDGFEMPLVTDIKRLSRLAAAEVGP